MRTSIRNKHLENDDYRQHAGHSHDNSTDFTILTLEAIKLVSVQIQILLYPAHCMQRSAETQF